jgi:hypothetical protein
MTQNSVPTGIPSPRATTSSVIREALRKYLQVG